MQIRDSMEILVKKVGTYVSFYPLLISSHKLDPNHSNLREGQVKNKSDIKKFQIRTKNFHHIMHLLRVSNANNEIKRKNFMEQYNENAV